MNFAILITANFERSDFEPLAALALNVSDTDYYADPTVAFPRVVSVGVDVGVFASTLHITFKSRGMLTLVLIPKG